MLINSPQERMRRRNECERRMAANKKKLNKCYSFDNRVTAWEISAINLFSKRATCRAFATKLNLNNVVVNLLLVADATMRHRSPLSGHIVHVKYFITLSTNQPVLTYEPHFMLPVTVTIYNRIIALLSAHKFDFAMPFWRPDDFPGFNWSGEMSCSYTFALLLSSMSINHHYFRLKEILNKS